MVENASGHCEAKGTPTEGTDSFCVCIWSAGRSAGYRGLGHCTINLIRNINTNQLLGAPHSLKYLGWDICDEQYHKAAVREALN